MLLGCKPKDPDAKCHNCKRLFLPNAVNVKNSKDRACIYMPKSLQKI